MFMGLTEGFPAKNVGPIYVLSSDVASAVTGRGSYLDWLNNAPAVSRSNYPKQKEQLLKLAGQPEDEVISTFVNLVVSSFGGG